jgi:hypothetical protein
MIGDKYCYRMFAYVETSRLMYLDEKHSALTRQTNKDIVVLVFVVVICYRILLLDTDSVEILGLSFVT